MVNVGIIGLGKMGLSQFSIINAHRDVKVVGLCDSSGYILDILGKYTGVDTYTDMDKMLADADVEAAVISTPSKFHAPMVRACLDRGIHVFTYHLILLNQKQRSRFSLLKNKRYKFFINAKPAPSGFFIAHKPPLSGFCFANSALNNHSRKIFFIPR